MKELINWAAIRETDGEQWIDISSLSGNREVCESKTISMNNRIPHWAKDNPIIRFTKVEVKLA